jgi:NAD(P)-dependent dehydrogenase (short-subunit alcohol dehydrogenase family)
VKTFIIGASRGVGRATALELASRGHDLALGYRVGTDDVEKLAAELGDVATVAVQGDVAREGARMVADAVDGLGGLDNVVVTAVPLITGPIAAVTREEADRAMDVQVHGFRDVVLAAREHLSTGGGSVVAVSSLGSARYAGYYGALGPAKAALESTVRYLAAELGPELIRVNAVSPCLIDDPAHVAEAAEVAKFLVAAARRTPLGRRLAVPADIARAIAGLLGPDFGYLTGQTIVLDGGYSLLA